MSADFEVVVAGGGMVGLALGLALAKAGVETAVVDGVARQQALEAGFDGRVSSFAPASRRMLEALGVWQRIASDAQPVLDIVVGDGSRRGASGALLHFDRAAETEAPLAHMVENRHFRRALHEEAEGLAHLSLIAPQQVSGVVPGAHTTQVTLANGEILKAQLCVAADGRNSPLREAMGIRSTGWDYGQTGIVATIGHERPHGGRAYELFLPSGPFAILPMTGKRSSIVWTERSEQAEAFLKLDDEAFLEEVRQRFGDQWGEIFLDGPRWSYPLSMHLALRYLGPRFALAGDAAHGVHPLAGQGLNLGLRDAAALAETVVEAKRLGLDAGAETSLARYEAWRRFDNALFAATMDVLNRLFSNDVAPVKAIRRFGLDLVDAIPPLKRLFMLQAAGEGGTSPRLMRGEAL